MGRGRIWSIVLISALAMLAGVRAERWTEPAVAHASVSSRPAPPESRAPDALDSASPFRLGRGVVAEGASRTPGRPQRLVRDWRRDVTWPGIDLPRPAEPVGVLPPARDSAPECPRFGEALRDGTCSSRSTGLPPPVV